MTVNPNSLFFLQLLTRPLAQRLRRSRSIVLKPKLYGECLLSIWTSEAHTLPRWVAHTVSHVHGDYSRGTHFKTPGWGLQTVREQLRDHIPLFCLDVCPPPLTIHTQLHLLKFKFNKIPQPTKEEKDCFVIDHSFNSLSKIAKTACVTECPTLVFQQMQNTSRQQKENTSMGSVFLNW